MSALRHVSELFANADADIIVRSLASDSADSEFRVHKLLLIKLFHGFEDMLGAPMVGTGDAQTIHDGLPVVTLTEPPEVLEHLLRLLYPVPFPDLSGKWPSLLALCTALDKYAAKFYPLVVTQALLLAAMSKEGPGPGAVYVIACRHPSMDGLLLDVAKLSLRGTARLDNVPKQLLSGMSAMQYHALVDYQSRCRQAALEATLLDHVVQWMSLDDVPGAYPAGGACSCSKVDQIEGYVWAVQDVLGPGPNDVVYDKEDSVGYVVHWLLVYLDAVRTEFVTDISGSVAVRSQHVVAALSEATDCAGCCKSQVTRMVSFAAKLAEDIERKINAIPFHDA